MIPGRGRALALGQIQSSYWVNLIVKELGVATLFLL